MMLQQSRYSAEETAQRWRRERKLVRHWHSDTLYSGRTAAGFAQVPETYQPKNSRRLGRQTMVGEGSLKDVHRCQRNPLLGMKRLYNPYLYVKGAVA